MAGPAAANRLPARTIAGPPLRRETLWVFCLFLHVFGHFLYF